MGLSWFYFISPCDWTKKNSRHRPKQSDARPIVCWRLRAPQAVFLIFQCYFLCSDGPVSELLFEFYVT